MGSGGTCETRRQSYTMSGDVIVFGANDPSEAVLLAAPWTAVPQAVTPGHRDCLDL